MTAQNHERYDFIVTGASGNIGRHLIPLLVENGHSVLAAGRDKANLLSIFAAYHGRIGVADYDDLARLPACDTLIHLAVCNNDRPRPFADFHAVNVDFAEIIAREFIRMKGKRFVNVSSTHALQTNEARPDSHYATSKILGNERLSGQLGDRLDTVHIGYFHAPGYFGERLKVLERLGAAGGERIFGVFKALKPATSASSLAAYAELGADASPSAPSIPSILTDEISGSTLYRILTRLLDLSVAIAILVPFSPVLALLAVAIRLDSPGPALFRQTRLGAAKAPFTLYKFRTMKSGTMAAGTHEISERSVTRLGRFLRRSKLDELPQAINLLRGEMTLVGPRPCLPSQEELIQEREALGVYALKPGVTGYAQVRNIDMSRPQDLALNDYIYKKVRGLLLDAGLLLQTLRGGGRGDPVAKAKDKLEGRQA